LADRLALYSPSQPEWNELRRSKLPNLTGTMVRKLSLDTLYSLLADADFDNQQDQMDKKIIWPNHMSGRSAVRWQKPLDH
jgi:hypothetical protein